MIERPPWPWESKRDAVVAEERFGVAPSPQPKRAAQQCVVDASLRSTREGMVAEG